jgi:hypothetical protein
VVLSFLRISSMALPLVCRGRLGPQKQAIPARRSARALGALSLDRIGSCLLGCWCPWLLSIRPRIPTSRPAAPLRAPSQGRRKERKIDDPPHPPTTKKEKHSLVNALCVGFSFCLDERATLILRACARKRGPNKWPPPPATPPSTPSSFSSRPRSCIPHVHIPIPISLLPSLRRPRQGGWKGTRPPIPQVFDDLGLPSFPMCVVCYSPVPSHFLPSFRSRWTRPFQVGGEAGGRHPGPGSFRYKYTPRRLLLLLLLLLLNIIHHHT